MPNPDTNRYVDRVPLSDYFVEVVGETFATDTVGGATLHFFKGIYNSPKGARLVGAYHTVRKNAPLVGVRFAVWGCLFATFDCTMEYIRQKEVPLNTIISAAAATSFHKMRQGLGASARSATMGGILMAFIKGSVILYDKFLAEEQHRVYKSWAEKQRQIWFGNGKHPEANEVLESSDAPQRKEPETAVSSGSETKVLESSDAHLPLVGVLSKPAAD